MRTRLNANTSSNKCVFDDLVSWHNFQTQTLNDEGRQKSCVRIDKQVQDFPSFPVATGYPSIPFSIRARWVQSSLWVTFCCRKFLFSLSRAPDVKSRIEALIRLDTGSTSVHLRVNICLSTLKSIKFIYNPVYFLMISVNKTSSGHINSGM